MGVLAHRYLKPAVLHPSSSSYFSSFHNPPPQQYTTEGVAFSAPIVSHLLLVLLPRLPTICTTRIMPLLDIAATHPPSIHQHQANPVQPHKTEPKQTKSMQIRDRDGDGDGTIKLHAGDGGPDNARQGTIGIIHWHPLAYLAVPSVRSLVYSPTPQLSGCPPILSSHIHSHTHLLPSPPSFRNSTVTPGTTCINQQYIQPKETPYQKLPLHYSLDSTGLGPPSPTRHLSHGWL